LTPLSCSSPTRFDFQKPHLSKNIECSVETLAMGLRAMLRAWLWKIRLTVTIIKLPRGKLGKQSIPSSGIAWITTLYSISPAIAWQPTPPGPLSSSLPRQSVEYTNVIIIPQVRRTGRVDAFQSNGQVNRKPGAAFLSLSDTASNF
jgi:hypothetical protein